MECGRGHGLPPSAERLRKAFRLDPDQGKLFWADPGGYHREKLDQEAGCLNGSRWVIRIDGKAYSRSQIVFCIVHGIWPGSHVRHLNGDSTDDRPGNLERSERRVSAMGKAALDSRYSEHIGRTFGSLLLAGISESRGDGKRLLGDFICSCGQSVVLPIGRVVGGRRQHCGCLTDRGAHRTHGMRWSPEYRSWQAMKARCLDPGNKDYPRWGGKGITIYPRWVESFEEFYEHIGPRPDGTSIDRIDNTLGYIPGNVRWATRAEQARNTCAAYVWHIKGITFETLKEAAQHFGVSDQSVWRWVNGSFDRRRNRQVPPQEYCYAERRY
ncbi:hypothetical protein D9M69_464280 [compost metagenome]